jgi:hypothetical protein
VTPPARRGSGPASLNLGILAHVAAGRTSLTERLLHAKGAKFVKSPPCGPDRRKLSRRTTVDPAGFPTLRSGCRPRPGYAGKSVTPVR